MRISRKATILEGSFNYFKNYWTKILCFMVTSKSLNIYSNAIALQLNPDMYLPAKSLKQVKKESFLQSFWIKPNSAVVGSKRWTQCAIYRKFSRISTDFYELMTIKCVNLLKIILEDFFKALIFLCIDVIKPFLHWSFSQNKYLTEWVFTA